jgi:hypothetical protein
MKILASARKGFSTVCVVLMAAAFAAAAPEATTAQTTKIPAFPKVFTNARYVYVTSYDGNQFSLGLSSEDRQAIAATQDALQKSGKFVVVYRPWEADLVVVVESLPSEDILAVYDAHSWPRGTYWWRVTGRNGLQQNETPLVSEMLQAFNQAAAK